MLMIVCFVSRLMGAGFVLYQRQSHVLKGITQSVFIRLPSIKFNPQRPLGIGLGLYNPWETAQLRADRSCPTLIRNTFNLPHEVPELRGNLCPERLGDFADSFKRKQCGVVMNT